MTTDTHQQPAQPATHGPERRAVHYIEWTFDRDHVIARAVCTAPEGADCRLVCRYDCEAWWIERDQDGNPFHSFEAYDQTADDDIKIVHEVKDVGYCNVCDWLNHDPGLIAELATEDTKPFTIGTTPIEPVWPTSIDGYEWTRADGNPLGEQPGTTAADAGRGQLQARLDAIATFHREWGETDLDDIDQLDLWEQLGRILSQDAS